jgi:hypothetical protein
VAVSDTENTKDRSALLNLVKFISPRSSGSRKLLGPRHRWRESEQFRHTQLQYSGDWLYETPKEPKKPIVFKVNRLQRSISLGNITRLGCHPPLIVVTHTPKYEHFELIYMRQRHRAMRILRNRLKKPAPEFQAFVPFETLTLGDGSSSSGYHRTHLNATIQFPLFSYMNHGCTRAKRASRK